MAHQYNTPARLGSGLLESHYRAREVARGRFPNKGRKEYQVTKWLSVTSKVTEQDIVQFQLQIYFDPLPLGAFSSLQLTA